MSEEEKINIVSDETGNDFTTDETETDVTTDETETDVTTDETETDVTTDETETEGTITTDTCDTADDTSDTLSTLTSEIERDKRLGSYHSPQDIVSSDGRRIKAEDFEWRKSPVPSLKDIIVESADQIESADLENLLKTATTDQRQRILQILPLDLPLKITLPLLEDGTYWRRMCCSKSWSVCDKWHYSDSFKSMFIHKSVQDLVENFNPDENDLSQLCETLNTFAEYETSLKIRKLVKKPEKKICVDLSSEDFEEILDDIVAMPEEQIYVNFEKLLGCFEHLQDLVIILSPMYIDHEDYHFNNTDFNYLLRGLKKLKDLKKLRISNSVLSNEQLIVILKTFLTHECLAELNFSYNFINNEVCDYIGQLLISRCPLESLVLKYNKITYEGVKTIAAALTINSKLKNLDLSQNMVGDEGGCFLARALLQNRTLSDLDVSKNNYSEQTGVAFAKLMGESDNLKNLMLQNNFLGEAAGRLLADSMESNSSLLQLDVHFCGLTHDEEDQIYQAILRNRCKSSLFQLRTKK